MPSEYVLKLSYLLVLTGLLLLQSCQNNNSTTSTAGNHESKLNDAATYNTQLGLAYLKQGDRSRAKRKLLLALAQAPNSPNVNASMAYFMEKSGEMDKAQVYYQKAMSAAHGGGAQLNNYGAFLCRRAQYKQAEDYFLKATQDTKYEHTAGAYENAGLCATAIPDYIKATTYFSKALEQDPSRAQSLFELVNIQIKQGNNIGALTYLQKYPELTLRDRTLLAMAVDVAHKTGKIELEADYKVLLHSFSENTGGKNEYNNNNG